MLFAHMKLYHYAPTRAQSVPDYLLADYTGYLQTDGYTGYNAVLGKDSIEGLGCWAHVRRKFMDAKKVLPKAQQAKGNKVQQALAFITALYQLERAIASLDANQKQQRRHADAVPILERFKSWLDKQSVPPKTLLGKAIGYTPRTIRGSEQLHRRSNSRCRAVARGATGGRSVSSSATSAVSREP